MGESPKHVYNVGALGVENIRNLKLLERSELEDSLKFKLDKPFFLVTFHPVTLEKNSSEKQFIKLLAVLDQYPDHKFIFTGANADTDGKIINQLQNDYKKKHPDKCLVESSLGYLRYLSAMKLSKAVVGNSSSGILEAPALKIASVNIGDRQKGRLRVDSIIDCESSKDSMIAAFKKISQKTFQTKIKNMVIPFERTGTSEIIKETLQNADLTGIMKKKFFDILPDENSKFE